MKTLVIIITAAFIGLQTVLLLLAKQSGLHPDMNKWFFIIIPAVILYVSARIVMLKSVK